MTLQDRDPTNPISQKLQRDRELRGEVAEPEDDDGGAGFVWDYIVEPIIEAIGLLGLAVVLAVIAGAIYVWASIFLLGRSPV